jgi:hypothetical protein
MATASIKEACSCTDAVSITAAGNLNRTYKDSVAVTRALDQHIKDSQKKIQTRVYEQQPFALAVMGMQSTAPSHSRCTCVLGCLVQCEHCYN